MSKSINKVILVGTVGKDPEIRNLESGIKVATFSLATSVGGYTTKDGKQIEEKTLWHNIVAWRSLAELSQKYITKGMKLHVEGALSYREYEKDGAMRNVTDIIATDIVFFPTGEKKKEQISYERPMPQPDSPAAKLAEINEPESSDDLPF